MKTISKLVVLWSLGFPVAHCVNVQNSQNPDNLRAVWGYGTGNGPSTWPGTYATCAGSNQSPINIPTSSVVAADVGAITASSYDSSLMTGEFSNNEHTFVFTYKSGALPTISGGRLPAGERFNFLQLHWHWGSVSSQGSEHTVNGQEYPAELHLVHWNAKYADVAEAVTKADGLAVLGFFYEVTAEDNSDLTEILAIAEKARMQQGRIKKENEWKQQYRGRKKGNTNRGGNKQTKAEVVPNPPTVGPVSLTYSSLLPNGKIPDDYYYYKGSLTTPTCDEVVLWTVFTERIPISEKQLNLLRTLEDSSMVTLNDNFRPPQPLNGRTINKRFVTAAVNPIVGPIVALAQAFLAAGIATILVVFTGTTA